MKGWKRIMNNMINVDPSSLEQTAGRVESADGDYKDCLIHYIAKLID